MVIVVHIDSYHEISAFKSAQWGGEVKSQTSVSIMVRASVGTETAVLLQRHMKECVGDMSMLPPVAQGPRGSRDGDGENAVVQLLPHSPPAPSSGPRSHPPLPLSRHTGSLLLCATD